MNPNGAAWNFNSLSDRVAPIRSRSSSLTEDELTVIDPLFDSYAPKKALSSRNYASSFNTDYSHNLSDAELDACLERFTKEGLVFGPISTRASTYGLTPAGGSIWEAERRPIWELFCVASEGLESEGMCEVEITAYSHDVGRAYLSLAEECGVYSDFETADLLWRQPTPSRIYWKERPRPWCTAVHVRKNDWRMVDAERFKRDLKSWSDINDLIAWR